MFLYEDIRVNGFGSVGLISPTIGKLVNGTQVLGDDVSANIMMFLENRYAIVNPNDSAPTDQAASYLAVTPEKFVGFGYQVEAVPNAAQQLRALAAGRVVLANLDDVSTILQAQPLASGDFRFLVVDSSLVGKLAATGQESAVLNTGAKPAAATTASTEPKTNPLILPLVGGGIGFLVAGPVGALVGAGAGLALNYVQSKPAA